MPSKREGMAEYEAAKARGNMAGTYCVACRACGLSHCSDPINCDGMRTWDELDKILGRATPKREE